MEILEEKRLVIETAEMGTQTSLMKMSQIDDHEKTEMEIEQDCKEGLANLKLAKGCDSIVPVWIENRKGQRLVAIMKDKQENENNPTNLQKIIDGSFEYTQIGQVYRVERIQELDSEFKKYFYFFE